MDTLRYKKSHFKIRGRRSKPCMVVVPPAALKVDKLLCLLWKALLCLFMSALGFLMIVSMSYTINYILDISYKIKLSIDQLLVSLSLIKLEFHSVPCAFLLQREIPLAEVGLLLSGKLYLEALHLFQVTHGESVVHGCCCILTKSSSCVIKGDRGIMGKFYLIALVSMGAKQTLLHQRIF